jgi:dinuclear metal center YbgI/SA1388 family protein
MGAGCEFLFKLVEEFAPLYLAEQWDNPGLQLGDPRLEVNRLLLALDVDEDVYAEAIETGAKAIICHHPLFFKPVKQIRTDRPREVLIAALLRAGITVYAAHTNLDNADQGVNSELAKRLGLQEIRVLRPDYRGKYLKLVVFVPVTHTDDVRSAIARAGAGWIGNYSECTFQVQGTGTFRPLDGSNPFIGKSGELEHVEEIRLETILPANLSSQVVKAMLKAHPYEEAAYDLYPLANEGAVLGPGRIGFIAQPVQFEQFAARVKSVLGLTHVRCGGALDRQIRRVAVCGGSGAAMWPLALAAGAEMLVTSDVDYHTAKEMLSAGLNFIDAGHFGTERPILPVLQKYLEDRCRQIGLNVEILITTRQSDPFNYL